MAPVRKRKSQSQSQICCLQCSSTFATPSSLKRHMKVVHTNFIDSRKVFVCGLCDRRFVTAFNMRRHRLSHGELDKAVTSLFDFVIIKSALNHVCEVMRLVFPDNVSFLPQAFVYAKNRLELLLKVKREQYRMYKVAFILHIEFVKINFVGEAETIIVVPFRTPMYMIFPLSEVYITVMNGLLHIFNSIGSFIQHGSGWSIHDIVFFDVEFAKVKPISGSCGLHEVVYRRGCGIEMTNQGFDFMSSSPSSNPNQNCFYLAVAAHFLQSQSQSLKSATLDQFVKSQLVRTASVPVKLEDISAFEEANQHLNLAVNVIYKSDDDEMYPIYVSSFVSAANVIPLLMSLTLDKDEIVMHYAYVKNPTDFLIVPKQKYKNKYKYRYGYKLCFNCFNALSSVAAYYNHIKWCHQKVGQNIHYPHPGEMLTFDETHIKAKVAFTVYWDMESLNLKPKQVCSCSDEVIRNTMAADAMTENEAEEYCLDFLLETQIRQMHGLPRLRPKKLCKHKTRAVYEQQAFAYAFILVDRDGKVLQEASYLGEDAAEQFLRATIDLEEAYLEDLLTNPMPLTLTDADKLNLASAVDCYICGEFLGLDRVADHDHGGEGAFLGACHSQCNLNRREIDRIVCICQNFQGYDSHLAVSALHTVKDKIYQISAIPLNTQRLKMLQINRLLFIDSQAFLPASLEKNVETLVASNHSFNILKQKQWSTMFCADTDKEKEMECRDLMKRKGAYPYQFATSMTKLKESTALPCKSAFYQDIGSKEIADKDYAHAQYVWHLFGCSNMLDYTKLYNLSDVYLLAETVMTLRNAIFDEFQLDMCYYLSLPMLSKDIMLRQTGVAIQLVSDPEMSHIFQDNLRGGVSFINTRYVNSKSLSETMKKPMSLLYVDLNNLYGTIMSLFPLPLKNFEWMSQEELTTFDMSQISAKTGPGYVLQVTMTYPSSLHEEHNSFPLAPENIHIDESMLSPYARHCWNTLNSSATRYSAKKLGATFNDRVEYWVHGINLKYYLSCGLKLITIHKGIKFFQEPFLRSYIDTCTKKRAASSTQTESNMWKLLSNSLYGKMIENTEKRMDCKFVMDEQKAVRHFSDPLFRGTMILNEENCITFHMKKKVWMKQCYPIGFSILELSKYVLQHLYYSVIKPRFGRNEVSVIMSDTDSLLLAAHASSPDELVTKLSDVMDFSNYDKDHPLFDASRKNQLGLIKNEVPGDVIQEFIGLRAKTYIYNTEKNNEESKAKGVKSCYKKSISFSQYKECLHDIKSVTVNQISLQAQNHVNYVLQSNKLAFSSFDDKRYLLCSIHSVPYGSSLIQYADQFHSCYFCDFPDRLV